MSKDHIHFNFSLARKTLLSLASMIIGAGVLSATLAVADGQRSTQSVLGSDIIMPYDGYLMVDATPITGVRTIKFDLYQSPTGGNAVWTESQTVNLYNGRFSVGLGSATSLTDTILDAEKLYLSMTIVESDAQGNVVEIPLAGRQSIEPAPFAAWAANSADKQVAGNLDVAGNATVAGSATVTGATNVGSLSVAGTSALTGDVTAAGKLTVNGDTQLGNNNQDRVQITGRENDGSVAALRIADGSGALLMDANELDSTNTLQLNTNSGNSVEVGGGFITRGNHTAYGKYLPKYSNWNGTVGDGDASIVNDNGSHKALMIHGNKSADGTTRVVRLWDKLEVRGELTAIGNVTLGDATSDTTTVSGDLTVNGNLKSWPEGHYCIVQSSRGGCSGGNPTCSTNGSNCPSGFTAATAGWDTDNNDILTNNQINGTTAVSINGGNAGMQIYFCCK